MNRIKASIAKRNAGLQSEATIASPQKSGSRAVVVDDEEDPPEPFAETSGRKSGKASASRRVIDIDDSSEDERVQRAKKGKGRAKQVLPSTDTSSGSEDAGPSTSRHAKATVSAKAGKKGKGDLKAKGRETEDGGSTTSATIDSEVKRLQALVVTCGVRKQWKTEYAKHSLLDDASKAAHLHHILLELGMKPEELTLERADEIRALREMDKEAAELASAAAGMPDAASGTGRGASRASKTQANKRTRDELRNQPGRTDDDDGNDGSEEEGERSTKRADRRADKNMDAFLGMLGLGNGGAKTKASKSKGQSAKSGGRRLGDA